MSRYRIPNAPLLLALLGMALAGCPAPQEGPPRYTILVENNTAQPLGPVVAATHSPDVAVWESGQLASAGMADLAENGSLTALTGELQAQSKVTKVAATTVSMPAQGRVVPRFVPGTTGGPDLVDNQTLEIEAQPGDRVSIVSALLGTNDGFWGLDAVELPEAGSLVYFALGYDAGTEENNELEEYINDHASILGPAAIPGDEPESGLEADNWRDPTTPPTGIRAHDGILGEGDIPPEFDFNGLLVRVTITAVTAS